MEGAVVVSVKPTFARDLARKITETAARDGRLIGNREYIRRLARTDFTTVRVRGTADVMTAYGSPAFITRVTSRSASFTEVFFADPDDRKIELMNVATHYLMESVDELLIMDKQMGLHPDHSHYCRTIVTRPFARLLLMWEKLIFEVPKETVKGEPDQILIMVPEWYEVASAHGLPQRAILCDATNRVTFVLGTDYFGEIKKGHLRMAMYREKVRYFEGTGGGLGVHAGGKVIRALNAETGALEDKGALFFGLSGTGKTTLSVHHLWLDPEKGETVIIRQDDFFVMTEKGPAYGTEDNAYIKTEGLEAEGQPLLYAGATAPHAVLENVYVDPETRNVDFFTYDHPYVPGGQCYNGRGIVVRRELDYTDDSIDLDRVDMIFFITRRETVVPPVARLSTEQAAAFFMLGESILTSAADPTKAGQSVREVGTNPFIVGSKGQEGNIFYKILKANPQIQCFLLNTGGFGGKSIDRATEKLDSPVAVDKLRRYLNHEKHPDVGTTIELELRDGTKEKFKIGLVRYETFHGVKRVRLKKNLQSVLEGIEEGRIKGSDVELIEVEVTNGTKLKVQDSAAIIREIARERVTWEKDPYWGYDVAAEIPGMDIGLFKPERFYSEAEIKILNDALKEERALWLESFPALDPTIAKALG
jgi:phosphoenolpyruvate carboxykinase (ATP)